MPSSPPSLTPVASALSQLLNQVNPLARTENLPLAQALNRVLAKTQIASINVPPTDNSAMDGYAIQCHDIAQIPTHLPISQRICAGDVPVALSAQTVARIFTGAPIPANADAVVMQEHCQADDRGVTVLQAVKVGQNIRRAGEDIVQGSDVLRAGCRLRAQELGLAASLGIGKLPVYQQVKVAVFTTGDELLEPDEPLTPGKIYNSNRYTLLGLLQTLGCQIIDLGQVADHLAATQAALSQAAEQADLIITTGGVSVGEEDHVRHALLALGRLHLWKIAVKPGKPLAFGQINTTPFIGLPGNPVSAFVTFCLFVAPLLKKMQGLTQIHARACSLPAYFAWPTAGKRQEYLRARLAHVDGRLGLELYPHQGSGVLSSVSFSDGLVEVPIGTTIQHNEMVQFYFYSELLA